MHGNRGWDMADGFDVMVDAAQAFFGQLQDNNEKAWFEPRKAQYADDIAWLRAGEDKRIKYIDDLGPGNGQHQIAPGHGEGSGDEGRGTEDRRMA